MNAELLTFPTSPTWHELAHCRSHPELDWIEAAPGDPQTEHCKRVCRCCPVRLDCLAAAMENQEPWGVWGGLDADQRTALAKRSNIPAPRTLPPHGLNTRYAKHGCRCRPCREAHRVYERCRRAAA